MKEESEEIRNAKTKGYFVANVVAFTLIGLTKYLYHPTAGAGGTFIFSEFVIIPMLMGIICAWYWRKLDYGIIDIMLISMINTLIAIILSYVFLAEGVICLIIVSPLIFIFIALGVLIGRAMFRYSNGRFNVSIIALLLFVFIADSLSTHHYENKVSDKIIINTTPDKIWKYVVAFEKIKQPNHFWLFDIGLPSPSQTTVGGYYKGAWRKCIFSNGYTFKEVISTYDENKDLVFDITDQPRDPEIMNHLDLLRGEFVLHDNGNGTTTLTGNSWYRLYVFPAWYYDTWAQSIVRNVHLRVMEHIKELSEAKR